MSKKVIKKIMITLHGSMHVYTAHSICECVQLMCALYVQVHVCVLHMIIIMSTYTHGLQSSMHVLCPCGLNLPPSCM